MIEFFRKKENPETVARKKAEQRTDILTRIAELEAHVKNGNGTLDDAKLVEKLQEELAAIT